MPLVTIPSSNVVRLVFRLAMVGAIAIVVRFLLDAVGVPIGRWHYFAGAFALIGLITARRAMAAESRGRALLVGGVFTLAMIGTVGVPWTSRDRFLLDLERVQPGMTREQVGAAMQQYMVGTGVQNMPGVRTIHTGSRTFRNEADSATLSPQGCDVYRHSNDGRWDSDWGIVCYESDRVVSTTFSPD